MRAHVIENGIIVNTIVVDSLDFMPGLIDADLVGGTIGDKWNGTVVTKSPRPADPQQPQIGVGKLRELENRIAAIERRLV